MAATEEEIIRRLKDQREAMEARDIDRLMAHYSHDVVYFDVVPPLQFFGADALRTRFGEWFDGWESSIKMEIRDVRIMTSGDAAWASRFSRAVGTLKGGRPAGAGYEPRVAGSGPIVVG